MRLMNEEIAKRLPPLYSTDGQGENALVAVKYYIPDKQGGDLMRWVITEGERQADGDYLLYGLCDMFCREWGYTLLSDLESITVENGSNEQNQGVQFCLYDNKTVDEVAGPDPWQKSYEEIYKENSYEEIL